MKKIFIDDIISLDTISVDYKNEIFSSFDKDVIEFLPFDKPPLEIGETENFIRHSINQIEKGDDLIWVILFDNKFIGCCGIHSILSKRPHFGIWIKKDKQGKGYGKKVVHFMLKWALDNLDIEFLKYPVDKRNHKSIKLLDKLNVMQFDEYEMGNEKKLKVIEYRLYKTEK